MIHTDLGILCGITRDFPVPMWYKCRPGVIPVYVGLQLASVCPTVQCVRVI